MNETCALTRPLLVFRMRRNVQASRLEASANHGVVNLEAPDPAHTMAMVLMLYGNEVGARKVTANLTGLVL